MVPCTPQSTIEYILRNLTCFAICRAACTLQVDMMFTARGFGKEDVPVDNSDFMALMDEGEGMMMMDDDE